MICTRCGTQNEPRARYCSACGAALYATLPPTERQPMTRSAVIPPLREIHRADPLLGLIIAERYRVIELIGRGGMGVVYKAEHSRIGKVLALKLLTGELTRHNEQVVRFKREALMASRLSHPNTVQVFDFGDADGLAYLAMEYVKGESLGALVDRIGPLGPDRTARIVIQVCSSLAEATSASRSFANPASSPRSR
jgi:serine/threonine-protein kinase